MIGIIGGSGLDTFVELSVFEKREVVTGWGAPSAPLTLGQINGSDVCFLARHGSAHQIPPHKINYRANIAALREVGVTRVVTVNAVGGIDPAKQPGDLVLPDQLIDYTWEREHTFFDGQNRGSSAGPLEHIDFTYPFDQRLREHVLSCAAKCQLAVHETATCAVTQGPRLETAAEIKKMASDGCHIVGMTSMPEAALAKEAGLAYVCLALVVNAAAGVSGELISEEEMKHIMDQRIPAVKRWIAEICNK